MLKRVSIKGVVIGSVADILASNLLAIPFFIYIAVTRGLSTIPKDQIASVLLQTLRNDPVLFATQIAMGSLCSVLGGYIAARIAKHHEVLNGSLAAFLCVGSGVYSILFSPPSLPLWQQLLLVGASPALSAFGGYLRLKSAKTKPDA